MGQTTGRQEPYGMDPTVPVAADQRYGKIIQEAGGTDRTVPFANTTEACNLIPVRKRFRGMPVIVENGASTALWWWPTIDLSDAGLVMQTADVDLDGYATTQDLELKANKSTTVNGQSLANNVVIDKASVGLSNVPNVDATQAANITTDGNHQFSTAAEKAIWNGKQDALTFDNAPTAGSNNPVKSSGTKDYADSVGTASVAAANAYTDAAVTSVYKLAGDWSAAGGTFPTVGTGTGNGIVRGNIYNISVEGTIAGKFYEVGDSIYAKVANPGQVAANWGALETNQQQSTETSQGTAKVVTQAVIQDETTLEDKASVTSKKFWLGLARFVGIDRVISGNWNFTGTLKQNNNAVETVNNKDQPNGYAGVAANGSLNKTTDFIVEGNTNKYFTTAKVLATLLTGYLPALGTIAATDSILVFANKVGAFIASKDASDGFAGLTGFKINFKNTANTFISYFLNANTASRNYTFPDKDGTVAMLVDLTQKALLAELNAGTIDTKYITPKLLADSKYEDQTGTKTGVVLQGTNTYTATQTPAVTTFTDGMRLRIKPASTNTGASTLDLNNGQGVFPIQKSGGNLQANDMPAGQWQDLSFSTTANAGAGAWQLTTAIYNKLNTGANITLAGTGNRITIVMPDGTAFTDANFYIDPTTRTLTIGSSTVLPGNLVVYSNEFKLKVQENIASGQASIEFNDNQAKALVFKSTDGKEYIALRSTDNDEAVIFLQKFVVDQGVFCPLNTLQMRVSTVDASKTYFLDTTGSIIRIPFDTDNTTMLISGVIKGVNNTGSIGNDVLSGDFKIVLKRIGGVISVVSPTPIINRYTDTLSSVFVVGAEGGANAAGTANSAVLITVTSKITTTLDWTISKLEYSI